MVCFIINGVADTIKLSDEAKVWLASHLFDSGNAPTKCVPHLMLSIFSRILTHLFEPDNHFGLPGEAVGAAAKDLATKLRGKTYHGPIDNLSDLQ